MQSYDSTAVPVIIACIKFWSNYFFAAFNSFLFWVGFFFGNTLIFLPSIILSCTRKLCIVSEAFAPCDIQYFIRSAIKTFSPAFGLYVPSNSKNFPLLVLFFESVKTTRKDGSFFLPILCNLIFNILVA